MSGPYRTNALLEALKVHKIFVEATTPPSFNDSTQELCESINAALANLCGDGIIAHAVPLQIQEPAPPAAELASILGLLLDEADIGIAQHDWEGLAGRYLGTLKNDNTYVKVGFLIRELAKRMI